MPTIGNTTASESPVPSESYVSGETTIRLEDHVADADAHAGIISTHESDTSTHGVTTIVGEDETQTLSNKTLVAPTITGTLTAAAISASGNITVGGTLGATSGTFSGTLAVTGDLSVNTNKFNVTAASGNTAVAGTLGVTGNFAVNTNKFTVAAASGNTVVAGTLGVTGNVTVDTNVLYVDTSANKVGINTTPSYPLHVAVNTDSNEVLARFENSSAGSSAQVRATFTRGADAGTGTARGGVLFVSGSNFGIADYEARAMRFYTGASAGSNTERLTILAGGNVGIGQSTPTYGLDVGVASRFSAVARFNGGSRSVGGFSAAHYTLGDDAAASFDIGTGAGSTTPYGVLTVALAYGGGSVSGGATIYFDDHNNAIGVIGQAGTDTFGVYNTSLAGTTGTDNQFNVGVSNGLVYVENRTGHAAVAVTVTFLGTSAIASNYP